MEIILSRKKSPMALGAKVLVGTMVLVCIDVCGGRPLSIVIESVLEG